MEGIIIDPKSSAYWLNTRIGISEEKKIVY